MKTIVPDYYLEFKCIASRCRHTCCKGWEVEIDEESLARFKGIPDIANQIESDEDIHFRLLADEVCPFLRDDGLCDMIVKYGEQMLCQTCTDHPRFRNFWEDRVEMGLGMVCEEAARLILTRKNPMELVVLSDDGVAEELPEDEVWLMEQRAKLLDEKKENGPLARFREYLIYRHIADALYDDRLDERIMFVDELVKRARVEWEKTDGSIEALTEIVRLISYDVEYDEDEKERMLNIQDISLLSERI